MRVPSGHGREPLELKMTPMIDVVFLLLVFFLWTSSFEEPEFLMPSAIADPPAVAGAKTPIVETPTEPFDEMIVRVQWVSESPAILLNDQPLVSVDELRQRLQAILAIGVGPPVVIDPDADVPMGIAIRIYDAARGVGFDRVLFAARAEASPMP